jgi:hypothetical protein
MASPAVPDSRSARPVLAGGGSLSGLRVGSCAAGRVLPRGGGLGGLDHLGGHLVVGVGGLQAPWQVAQDWPAQSAQVAARSRL